MKLEDLAKLVNGKDYGYNVEKPSIDSVNTIEKENVLEQYLAKKAESEQVSSQYCKWLAGTCCLTGLSIISPLCYGLMNIEELTLLIPASILSALFCGMNTFRLSRKLWDIDEEVIQLWYKYKYL